MSLDVYLAHSDEDASLAEQLAKALQSSGFSVSWSGSPERANAGGAKIETAQEDASCVLLMWTAHIEGPAGDTPRAEAALAKARGVLVSAIMEPVQTEPPVAPHSSVDLVSWNGSIDEEQFQTLVSTIRARIAATKPAKKQVDNTPVAKKVRVGRLALGSLSLGGLLAAFSFFADIFSVQEGVCSFPVVQPWLSDRCGDLGLGGKPKRDERIAWEKLPKGDCGALREFGDRFPSGAYHRRAAEIVSLRTITEREVWTPKTHTLPLVVGGDGASQPSRTAAQDFALSRGLAAATSVCNGFAATSSYRLVATTQKVEEWSCDEYPTGHVCGFAGAAVCSVEVRGVASEETCAIK